MVPSFVSVPGIARSESSVTISTSSARSAFLREARSAVSCVATESSWHWTTTFTNAEGLTLYSARRARRAVIISRLAFT